MEQSFIEYSLGKDASSATLWVYPARKPGGKAIIMCPGGGFNQVASDHEGRDFAAWFNNQGITYAVLNYRMPHGDVEVIREDIREAIRLIRCQSAEWGSINWVLWELLSEAILLLLPLLFIPGPTAPTFRYCFILLSA